MTGSHPVPSIVPDASVAAKWYLTDEDLTVEARGLLEQFRQRAAVPLVPDCFYYELTGLIRRAERRQPPRLSPAQVDAAITDVVALPIPSVESRPYLSDMLRHSRALNVAVYDALYVAVAERASATFVTADKSLYDRILHLPFVRWLGDLDTTARRTEPSERFSP